MVDKFNYRWRYLSNVTSNSHTTCSQVLSQPLSIVIQSTILQKGFTSLNEEEIQNEESNTKICNEIQR